MSFSWTTSQPGCPASAAAWWCPWPCAKNRPRRGDLAVLHGDLVAAHGDGLHRGQRHAQPADQRGDLAALLGLGQHFERGGLGGGIALVQRDVGHDAAADLVQRSGAAA
jgi:hypothetical protein